MIPVFWDTYLVGHLDVDRRGPAFIYDQRWVSTAKAFPISLRMPMTALRYEADVVHPWLANLLPEAQALTTIGRRLGVAPDDVVGILSAIGHDTAGGMSIGQPDAAKRAAYREIPDAAALARIIRELPAKPFLVGDEGVSMSLAGAQEKLPVAIVDDRLCIPTGGAPSTHILKPANLQRLFGSVENEALCMTLAHRCGLPVAPVTTGIAEDSPYLLVTRYDRQTRPNGGWYRLHQEDFCQALGLPPSAKYERNQTGVRGPRIVDMFDVVGRHMTAVDKVRLLDAVIFNALVNNTDAHAKNYSIILTGRGASLAPLYDVMCASRWNVTQNLSQTIGGKDRGDHVHGRHWQRLADQCGLQRTMILEHVEKLAQRTMAEVDHAVAAVRAMPAGEPSGMLGEFASAIQQRCHTMIGNLSHVEQQSAPRAAVVEEEGEAEEDDEWSLEQ